MRHAKKMLVLAMCAFMGCATAGTMAVLTKNDNTATTITASAETTYNAEVHADLYNRTSNTDSEILTGKTLVPNGTLQTVYYGPAYQGEWGLAFRMTVSDFDTWTTSDAISSNISGYADLWWNNDNGALKVSSYFWVGNGGSASTITSNISITGEHLYKLCCVRRQV